MAYVVIRWLIGFFCAFFAHFFGRSLIRFRRSQERQIRMMSWAIRTVVTGAVVAFHFGFDRLTLVVYSVALLAFTLGVWLEWKPKHHDELEKVMFPRD